MKLRQLTLAALFFSGLTMAGMANAGDADFTLVNKTGYTISEIYISPSHKDSWGNDRLGKQNLDNKEERLFKFSDKSSCLQDLKVIFADDESEVEWQEFNLCELNKITIKYDRKTKTVSADSE